MWLTPSRPLPCQSHHTPIQPAACRLAALNTPCNVLHFVVWPQAWVAARKESNFSKFAPFLQQWVDVNKQKAAAIDPAAPAYDVLLDDYEKGMTSARLDEIFAEVRMMFAEAAGAL